jgi:hypothetical protein
MMKDCFAYKGNSCTALKVKQCEGCGFYKTKEQYELGREKVLKRLRSLDAETRKYIFDKYYGGKPEVEKHDGKGILVTSPVA